jgi:uncharacterized protein (DUF342 family)
MSDGPAGGEAPPKGKPQAAGDDSRILDSLKELLQDEDLGPQEEGAAEEEELPAPEATPEKKKRPAVAKRHPETHAGGRDRRVRDMQAFRDLDAQMASDTMGLDVSADRLTAQLKKVDPDDTLASILSLLQTHKITAGIDQEAIRTALTRARGGAHQYDVVVARGVSPVVRRPGGIHYHLPAELVARKTESGFTPTPYDELRRLLGGPLLGDLAAVPGPVAIVHRGDVVAELRAAQVEPGRDVFGGPIIPEQPPLPELKAGENTALSEDGQQCTALLYGYAGLVEGVPTVLPPLWIPASQQEARFVCLPPPKPVPPPTEEEVEEVLKARWVSHGVLPKRVVHLCRQLAKGKTGALVEVIAQGEPAKPGENAKITHCTVLEQLPPWNQLQKIRKCKDRAALEELIGEICAGEGTVCKSTRAGLAVAEKTPATKGVLGKDIQGEEVIPEEGKDVDLKAGENVTLGDGGLRCTADIYGYVCRHGDQVSVVPPVWIGEGKEAVYFLNLSGMPPAEYPSVEEIQELLRRQGKGVQGFRAERWAEVLQGMHEGEAGQRLVVVSEGTPAQAGRDAEFRWALDVDEKPGTILDDGSIDFRDRHLVTVVDKDEIIGKLIPAQPGVAGKDVFGNEIAAPVPLEIEVAAGPKVRVEKEESGVSYYAAAEGGVTTVAETKKERDRVRKKIKIDLYALFTIDGDVDYNTGNIDFNGDVYIKGSVRSNFSVKATGSVSVGELVEGGARVHAGRDILVQAGVVGRTTQLAAGGSVTAKFIQEASVRTGGDVKVGTYLLEATVRARGSVIALGKGEGKGRAVVGGLIWGARGIEARSLGSPSNANLRIVTGVDPDEVAHVEQLRARMRTCEEQQRKVLMTSFGLRHLDPELIKQKLRACSDPQDKKLLLRGVRMLSELTEKRQSSQKEMEAVVEAQRKLARQAAVVVSNELFAGVEIRVGEHSIKIQEDKERVSIRLVEEDERTVIQVAPL